MKNILVIVLLFIGNILFAQDPQIVLDIKLTHETTQKKLAGVSVEIYKDGAKISTSTTSSKGAVDVIIVPVGAIYKVKFKKDGFVTKMIEINGYFDTPEDLDDETYYEIKGSLFESVEGVDFSFLENEPMLKLEFTADGYDFIWDQSHYKTMKKQIVDLKEKIEKEKIAAEKAEKERVEREADYNTYVIAGDRAVGNSDYQLAVDQYSLALKLIDKPEVKTKLENAKKLLAEAGKNAQKEENFKALMVTAKASFQSEDWQGAKDKYNEALKIKPNESTATSQIKLIDKKMAELKADEDKLKAVQEKYLAKMSEANTAYSSNEFDKALGLYEEAKLLKPHEDEPQIQINKIVDAQKLQASNDADFTKFDKQGDVALAGELYADAIMSFEKALKIKPSAAVQTKIDNAKKLRDEKTAEANESKLKEEKYEAAIKAANMFFDTEKWDDALVKYKEALVVKSEETHPSNRIKEIEAKLLDIKAKNEASNLLDKEYNDLIKAADDLYTANKLDEARQKYSAALGKKSGEKHPIDRIELINSTLAKQAADKVIEDKYLAELNSAKTLFDSKDYEGALSKYNLAAQIKPIEQEPKDKIVAINKILNDQKNSAQLQAEYAKFMEEGNGLLANNDLTTALDKFKKALNVKENDLLATSKIKEVEKLIKDKQESELKQKEFDEFVKKAETSFSAENYQDAKVNYSRALNVLPDATIDAKIKEIDKLIAKNQSAAEQQKLFDDAMKIADDLYGAEKYAEALPKYEVVNAIKESQHADDRINTIKNNLANAKTTADKDAKFNGLVDKASVFRTNKELQKAVDAYKEALAVKADARVSAQIAELEVLILNGKSDAQRKQSYIDMVDKANFEFKNNNWNQAIDYYEKAKKFKEANETYPDEKIAMANANIQSELDLEIDKKYLANINKADALFTAQSLDEATAFYKKALVIKSNEQHPKDKLIEIKKIQDGKANALSSAASKEEDYKKLVKEADNLLTAKNYSGALSKYEKALTEKPTDLHVISQIEMAKEGIELEKANSEKMADYDKLIAEGNALMKPKTWNLAKAKYESALTIFNETYPTNQIIICDEMMNKDSGSEAEAAYQKILTVAQKKMDAKDYEKAISLYERALGIRPSDVKPKDKIAEINQILKNKKETKDFDALMLKANSLFEKKEWRKARGFYVKAYAIINDSYADSQIKKIDELDGAYNSKQYNKMISKADEYFIDENYAKSKGLYERAIKFLPNNDNTYPINRIQEIKDILNPPLAIDNGIRDLGEKVVGMTEQEMDALLTNDSEQRKFNEVNSVKTMTKEMSSEKTEWSVAAKESTNLTRDKTEEIAVDQQIKGTIAEVERVKAEKATIEQRKVYDEIQKEIGIYTDQTRFTQKEVIENVKTEMAENVMNADIPREEYEQEVVGINTNLKIANDFQSAEQQNQSFDQREYVNKIQKTHVTQDPNNDVARKKTEAFVIEQNVEYASERKKESLAQEDAIMNTKVKSNLMVEEIRLSNVDNDIPRQNTVDKSIKIKEVNKNVQSVQSRNQIDVNYDIKNYTNKAIEEIRIESIANDIPRQNMEITAVAINDDVTDANYGFAVSQKKSTNATKDLIVKEIGIQQEAFATKDKERADDAENIIGLKKDLVESDQKISNKNKDVSFATKYYTDNQIDITSKLKEKGDNSIIKNQDETKESLRDFKEETDAKAEENQIKVNNTVDHVTKMKDIDIKKIDVNVKNKLGEDFPEGVTEEIYQVKDSHGLLLNFVVRRIVVTGGEGNVYEKTKSRHGVTSYTKNGDPISKQIWQDNTANGNLKSN